MREGWVIKKIGEIADVSYGYTGKAKLDGAFRYVRITDIDNEGKLIFDEKKYLEYSEEAEKYILAENDLLMARTGATFAKVLLYEDFEPSVYASYLIKIDFKVEMLNKLYWYFSKSINYWEQANTLSSGSAQPHFNGKALKNVVYQYPKSLSEQQQIVAILDEAFEAIDQAIANIEKNIENAKELFQSKLNDIFSQKGDGWEEKTLIEVNRFIDYRGKTPKKTDSGIKLITAKNVRMGYLRNEPEEFIAEEDYDDWMTRGIPREGDVLFTTEAPLANVTLLNTSEKIALAQRIITLCPNRAVLSGEYLTFCLQSKVIQDKILEKGTGATVTGIKSRLLKEIVIPIPPLNSQSCIVQVLTELSNETNDLIFSFQKKVENLEELKKSILQKAFAGELTNKVVTV